MIVSWDKTSDRIWFGRWGDANATILLYLVAEILPGGKGWDWSVWRSGEPAILKRGIAPSAKLAVAAAEAAAADWRPGGTIGPDE
jgi:hypothetical protein